MAARVVICPSCGAHFAAEEPRCPYCGTVYVPAAEQEYMDKLDDVREDLADVGEAAAAEHRREAKRTGRLVLRVLLAVAVIAAVIGGIGAWRSSKRKADDRAEYRWQREHFPQMDALFDAGEYDELSDLYEQALDDDHDMWQWDHRAFCELYRSARYGEQTLAFVTNEPSQKEKYQEDLLYVLLALRGGQWRDNFPKADRALIEEMTGGLQADLAGLLELTEDELAAFDAALKKHDGYPDLESVRDFFRKR